MSLVTIERSSSSDNLSEISGERAESVEDQVDADICEDVFNRSRTMSNVEGFFASKGAAYAIPDGDFARKASLKGGEIQSHLQGMVNVIRDEDTMRLVVKVESEAKYTRYLSIVTTHGLSDEEESCVLGFDWIEDEVTLGLVIPLWSNVSTTLDGDGGFEIKTKDRNYVFKPVSVQTLWTALLWIHKCLKTAHRAKHFHGGLSHAWLDYYQHRISSPQECINFWHSMDDLENKREICFSYFDKVKTDEELLKGSIRNKLKEILTRFDLEEVTCRQVREELEAEMKMSLQHLKGYVDEQLFVILGQMESSTKITDQLYLGSEWNACNLQELKENGVGYILNITKEVDNFFPGTFDYMNIRLYDVKEADLLCHWDETYRFLHKAKEHGSAALVHCRRGISRSASTVIAYIMKEEHMSLADAMKFVKSKRSIVQPNSGFWKQLITYEGILRSSRNRHNSIFRRRSNSADFGHVGRSHHKKGRRKNDVDQVDSTTEHAHTLPRMANEGSPGGNEEYEEMQPSDVTDEWEEGVDSISSSEDISSTSNSDEDSPSKMRKKIRRTVSEPVMLRVEDVTMTSPARKQRARTFAERSPTKIAEDQENEDDGVWMHSQDVRDEGDVVQQEEVADESVTQPDASESMTQDLTVASGPTLVSEVQTSVTKESVEIVSEIPQCGNREGTSVDDTRITEQFTSTGEVEGIEVADDVKQVSCEQSSRVDFSREEIESPREDVNTPREDVNTPCEDVNTPCVDADSPREDADSPREGSAREDHVTPPRTPRQRSRSIGEKLVDKLLVKQGRSESSDNLKKVNTRGKVKRRERKAKSDLQLSSSGFVKRHTQIIEEQMLYSLLNNSDKTPATLAVDFWENNSGNNSNSGKQNKSCEAQSSEKDMECEATTMTTVTDSEKCSEKQAEERTQDFQNNFEVFETDGDCCGSDNVEVSAKDNQDNSQKEFHPNCEQNSAEILEMNSQTTAKNFSGKKRCQELQDIVQEVNAEARRDIATQPDAIKSRALSQNELRHPSDSGDVTIDPMTWIDLTHHHGDVVKRRSAAFENNAKREPGTSLPESCDNMLVARDNLPAPLDSLPVARDNLPVARDNLPVARDNLPVARDNLPVARDNLPAVRDSLPVGRNNLPPSRDHAPNTCQEQIHGTNDTEKSNTVSHVSNKDIPKLDLRDLTKDDSCTQRANSIIVEDYNSWVASSVRDRTKILENMIAKTGGSFPSPRSRVRQDKLSDSVVEGQFLQRMDDLEINTSYEVEEEGQFHHSYGEDQESSCPVDTRSEKPGDDNVFGDAPVRSLVDKFEDWG